MKNTSNENPPNSSETIDELQELANEIESLKQGDDRVIDKLVEALRRGDREGAKLFCSVELDKFSPYRSTIVPILITKLFDGSGSPWFSVERQMKKI